MTRIFRSPFVLFCTAACAVLLTDPIGANSEVSAGCTGCLECGVSCDCSPGACMCHLKSTSTCTVGVRAVVGPEKEKADLERMSEGGGTSGGSLWFHPVGPWLNFAR